MLKRCSIHALVLASFAIPCAAQDPDSGIIPFSKESRSISAQCSQGVVYDVGSFTGAYSIGAGNPDDSSMVMKFTLPAGTTHLDQVCGCFSRRSSTDPANMSFKAVVYDDNGPGGSPGTFLGSVNATASALPVASGQFYSVNFTGSGIVLPDNVVYVGFRWPGGNIGLCGDDRSTTPLHTTYGSANSGSTWTSTQTQFSTDPPKILGVRLDPATTGGTANCTASSTAMCLNNNRFRVEATFDTTAGQSGQAQVVKLTDETGYLWFFDAVNVEVVVKAINACSFNNRYWVYSAGLTDVHVVLTVTDTETGTIKTYTNAQGHAFTPILDSSAFATCP